MYGWLTHFWIGDSESNIIEVGNMLSHFRVTPRKLKEKGRNVQGQLNKVSLDNIYENIEMNCTNMLIADVDILQSNILDIDEFGYIKFFEDGRYHSEHRTSLSVSQIQLRKDSRAFITVDSVVLASNPTGTNYGGTIDLSTAILTTASVLPEINSDVIITYHYKGYRGDISMTENSIVQDRRTGVWNCNFNLEGK